MSEPGGRLIETLSREPVFDDPMTRSPDGPICYRATSPLGAAGAITVIGLPMDPLVVLTVKPVMLLDALFDV